MRSLFVSDFDVSFLAYAGIYHVCAATVRYIPDWFPGAGFKRLALQIRSKVAGIRNIPFLWAKSQIVWKFSLYTSM